MNRFFNYLLLLVAIIVTAGCGSGGSSANSAPSGSVKLQIDMTTLQAGTAAAKSVALTSGTTTSTTDAATITAVTATLSRDGYTDIVRDLTVANNVATATISELAQGYWHVSAKVYNGQTLWYTGSADVKVVAGTEVTAEILFDPANAQQPATTGSVNLVVGINQFPGYSKISQFVSTILQDSINNKFYIFDSSAKIVAVYNGDTLVREKDIVLQDSPQAMAVDASGGSLLLGFSTGKVFRLNVGDESLTLLADSLISITSIVPISPTFALVANASDWGPSNTYETINLTNGQVVSSKSYWYPLSNFTYNAASGMVYALDSGLSPADIHHLAVNAATGSIDSIGDSRYHGDYYFGAPIRTMMNGSRIATGSGNMFVSSSSLTDDITFAGNLGHTLTDLVSDDALGNLYVLNSDNIRKLLILKQDTFFTAMSVDLVAQPMRVFNTPQNIIVFVKSGSDYYVKVFGKTTLGLL